LHTERHIPTHPSRNGGVDAGGVGTNRDSGQIAGYRSMTAATDDHAVYRTVNLCLSQPVAWTNTPKRREHNLIVRSGKAEAEVTNNKRLCSRYRTAEAITTDRHEASRGLSAITELLVSYHHHSMPPLGGPRRILPYRLVRKNYTVSEKTAHFLFLSELRHISTNFGKF